MGKQKRRAFTLVEILTVAVIICILAVVVTAAVVAAMRSAQRANISIQIYGIAQALEMYKAEFGEYPPDMFNDDDLVRHVKKRWPRTNYTNADDIRDAITFGYSGNAERPVDYPLHDVNLEYPPAALALWLGGFPNYDGIFSGFYADPEAPFTPSLARVDGARRVPNNTYDKKVFIDLEMNKNVQLVTVSTSPLQTVPIVGMEHRFGFAPVVYFRARPNGGPDAYTTQRPNGNVDVKQWSFSTIGLPEFGLCVPYADSASPAGDIRWHNPTTYQLIHPGLDGRFGEEERFIPGNDRTWRLTQSGRAITPADLDNQTNVSDYKELRVILP